MDSSSDDDDWGDVPDAFLELLGNTISVEPLMVLETRPSSSSSKIDG